MQAQPSTEQIRSCLAELDDAATELRQLGETYELPVLEHESARLQDIISVLSMHIPELAETRE